MRHLLCLILLLTTGAWSQSAQPVNGSIPSKPSYAREWWLNTDEAERYGFLHGLSDCMTWTAHKTGFSETPEQIMDKIDKFYKSHPESATLNVIDVWEKVADHSKPSKAMDKSNPEVWKNAHWYLNGGWWSQVYETEQLGFVEGYLWCLKTQVSDPTESYSKSASSYRRRIDAFVRSNPKLGKEAVAITLRRYRDEDAANAPN
jgi:hypothetical protein